MNQHHQIHGTDEWREQAPTRVDYTGSGAQTKPVAGLSQIIQFFLQYSAVIVFFIFASLALAAVYLSITPYRYTATSALMLDTRRLQLFQQQSLMSELSFDAAAVESQLEVLKSDALALSVLNTQELLKDPEFAGGLGSLTSAVPPSAAEVGMTQGAIDYLRGVVDYFASLTSTVPPPAAEGDSRQRALDYLKSNLFVQRVGRSYVIEISFRSLDRDKATRIANAIGDAYILDQIQDRYNVTRGAANWLRERVAELRHEAESADQIALDFRTKSGLTDAGGKLLSEQQLSEVNTQLILAKARTNEAKARLDRVSEIGKSGLENAALVDSLQNTVLNRLQQQYVDAAKREAEFTSRYGVDHAATVNLRKEMQQIQDVSKAEMNRIAESYKSEYEIARSREQAFQANLEELTFASADVRRAQAKLRLLESSTNAYRTLHDNFLQRFVEATQQESSPTTEARLITKATDAEKTQPRTLLVVALAAVLGAGLGCGVAFVRGQLDRAFRTARQIEQELAIECLGIIPTVANVPSERQLSGQNTPQLGSRLLTHALGMAHLIILDPFSRFSETIRAIKVAVDTSTGARPIKVIGLVSALPGEGKSTVAANLAQLMAHSGRRTLLIDADLRNSSLTHRMAPTSEGGILEVLNSKAQLTDVVWHDPSTGLDFLPAVFETPVPYTSEVISSGEMTRLIAEARSQYEYIVIDFYSAPSEVDAKAGAHHVDAFLLVVEWGHTSPDMIFAALGSAEVINNKVLGAILNKANLRRLKQFDSHNRRN